MSESTAGEQIKLGPADQGIEDVVDGDGVGSQPLCALPRLPIGEHGQNSVGPQIDSLTNF